MECVSVASVCTSDWIGATVHRFSIVGSLVIYLKKDIIIDGIIMSDPVAVGLEEPFVN